MKLTSIDDLKSKIPQILEQVPYLATLVLFGSRARGEEQEGSDWDLAVFCDEEMRKQYKHDGWGNDRLWFVLGQVLGLTEDEIDLVELRSCSGILAHHIAQDGLVIYEKTAGKFEKFRQAMLKSPSELKLYRQNVRAKVHEALGRWRA
jgi:uncharacterized protein